MFGEGREWGGIQEGVQIVGDHWKEEVKSGGGEDHRPHYYGERKSSRGIRREVRVEPTLSILAIEETSFGSWEITNHKRSSDQNLIPRQLERESMS